MRILMVSSWFPFPPDNGSRIRAHNILKRLAAKHDVTLLSFTDPDFLPEHAATIEQMGVRVSTTPRISYQPAGGRALAAFLSPLPRFLVDTHSDAMEKLIESELVSPMDVVLMGELSAAMYARAEMRPPKIFDDLETGIFYDAYAHAHGATRWRRRLTWWKMARYLQAKANLFEAVTVVSKQEMALAAAIGISETRLTVLPNAIDGATYENVRAVREPNTLIFSGALTYGANLDAMRYFVSEILPLIRKGEPDARLTITGRADQVAINELSGDNAVLFAGYVSDVRPRIASSSVCIVPLRVGGGTRLKILEAMALGTPVVSTSKGIEGLGLVAGGDVLVGDTPQEFAAQVLTLLHNPALAQQIAQQARTTLYERYDWNQIGLRLDDLLARVTHQL